MNKNKNKNLIIKCEEKNWKIRNKIKWHWIKIKNNIK